MGCIGSDVLERGCRRGARVWAAASGRAVDAFSLTPLCLLEGDQPLPTGLFCWRGAAVTPALPGLPEQGQALNLGFTGTARWMGRFCWF